MARWEVENPYLRSYNQLKSDASYDSSPLGMLFGALGLRLTNADVTRSDLTRKYGFAIPNRPALELVASCGPIVEMGAGTGYWAMLLRKMKVDVVAYDNFTGVKGYGFSDIWTPIIKGSTGRLADHPDRTLLLSWPCYATRFASNCLRYYRGNRLVYIGESKGGCTGNDHFFGVLKEEWTLIKRQQIPCWPGIHDQVELYERKEKLHVPKARSKAVRQLRPSHVVAPVRGKRRPAREDGPRDLPF